ncbi:MAG: phosphoadenosine phosphosulfate reductase [Gemmatimonadetes bacterium]|nr:phosphoadenosine phosphosulfate reductase [Gemmatimonadota bacterium]
MAKEVRHILGLSGGKDSAALAVLMHKRVPQMEYFFCDTHKELDETYEYLDRLKARLGIRIEYLSSERGFDHWLDVYGGLLPSPRMRWCTNKLKIAPLEAFVGDDEAVSYVGIRADERRSGYISTKPNISPVFPFKEEGYDLAAVKRLLEESGIGMPSYYQWRSRSGCFFCFYQKKVEWVRLATEHPDLFARAVAYEQAHRDGRTYTWTQGETLLELIGRRDEIIIENERAEARALKVRDQANAPLAQVLAATLDEEEEFGCIACHV